MRNIPGWMMKKVFNLRCTFQKYQFRKQHKNQKYYTDRSSGILGKSNFHSQELDVSNYGL